MEELRGIIADIVAADTRSRAELFVTIYATAASPCALRLGSLVPNNAKATAVGDRTRFGKKKRWSLERANG